jgi:hypothetical protein
MARYKIPGLTIFYVRLRRDSQFFATRDHLVLRKGSQAFEKYNMPGPIFKSQ